MISNTNRKKQAQTIIIFIYMTNMVVSMRKVPRYYDPANSRFLSQDTYRGENTDPSSLHLYAYCNNNPINFTDPTGHWAGSIHKYITKKALKGKGIKKQLKKKKIKKELLKGSVMPDKWKIYNTVFYFSSRKFHGQYPKLEDVKKEHIKYAKTYYKKRLYTMAARHLGIVLHTYQDYYAHNIFVGRKIIYYRDYKYKKGETHKNVFDNVKKYYSGGQWKKTSKKENPRIKQSISLSKMILKNF